MAAHTVGSLLVEKPYTVDLVEVLRQRNFKADGERRVLPFYVASIFLVRDQKAFFVNIGLP